MDQYKSTTATYYNVRGAASLNLKCPEGSVNVKELVNMVACVQQLQSKVFSLENELLKLKEDLTECAIGNCPEPGCPHYNRSTFGSTWGTGYQ